MTFQCMTSKTIMPKRRRISSSDSDRDVDMPNKRYVSNSESDQYPGDAFGPSSSSALLHPRQCRLRERSTQQVKFGELSNIEIEIEVDSFLDRKKFVEWHTHWHGIVGPETYVSSMFLFIGAGEQPEVQRSKRFQKAKDVLIAGLDERLKNASTTEERVLLSPIAEWLKEPGRKTETVADDVAHLLSSRKKHSTSIAVHWDLAYQLRSIIRDKVLPDAEEVFCGQRVPVEEWTKLGKWGKWIKDDTDISLEYFLDIGCISREDNMLKRAKMHENVVSFVKHYVKTGNESIGNLYLSRTTLRYLYGLEIRKALTELTGPNNKEFRCEIDGKPGLDCNLITDLCRNAGNGPSNKRLQLYFLFGLSTKLLESGTEKELNKKINEIEKALYKPEFIGTDFRGPEAVFEQKACNVILGNLYTILKKAARKRRDRGEGTEGETPVIMRIHVGESNMRDAKYDPQMEAKGRKNIDTILTACEMIKQSPTDKKLVCIRFGHVTAITVYQALRMRKMGIYCEINSLSNLETGAAEYEGDLPVLKLLIADALYRHEQSESKQSSTHSKSGYNMLYFTCNTDGAGIMHSNLKEEYTIAIRLINRFIWCDSKKFKDGSVPRVLVFPDDKDALEKVVNNFDELYTDPNENKYSSEERKTLRFCHFSYNLQKFFREYDFVTSAMPVWY